MAKAIFSMDNIMMLYNSSRQWIGMTYKSRYSIFLVSSISHRLMSTSVCSTSSLRTKDVLKNIVRPEKIPVQYWSKIILVAKELKESLYKSEKKCLKLLDTKHVTLLFVKPHGRFQLAFTLACDLLGARRTLYHDRNFENQPNPGDSGKVLSSLTDMFVIHGLHHDVLIKMVANADVPVFSASSDAHCLQKALSDLMTYQERLDRLKGLTLAWIGPPSSLFNSYLVLCTKFGINLHYHLICNFGSGRMSPVRGFAERKTLRDSGDGNDRKECTSVLETVTGAHIIATSMHPDENSRITLDLLKNADPNHVFMHSLPRSWSEVSDEVFNQKNNLSWQTSENYLYIAMAFILTSLTEYEPKSDVSIL